MKTVLLFIYAFLASFSLKAEDITLRDGKVLKGATVSRVDPSSISFCHDGGVARIPLENLTDEMLKQHGLNEQNANAFLENEAANKRKEAEQRKKEEAYRNLNMKSIVVGGRVLQAVPPDGALVDLEICHVRFPDGEVTKRQQDMLTNHEDENAMTEGAVIRTGEAVWVVQEDKGIAPFSRTALGPSGLGGKIIVVDRSHWKVSTIDLGVCLVEGLVNVKQDQYWGGVVWNIGTYTQYHHI